MKLALITVSAWLALIALLLLVFRREAAVTMHQLANPVGRGATDGLPLGSPQPRLSSPAVPPDITLLFLDPRCAPCHTLLQQAKQAIDPSCIQLVIVDGSDPLLTEELRRAAPSEGVVHTGEDAGALQSAYRVHSEPFAIGLEHGIVAAKRYVRSDRDLRAICHAKRSRGSNTPIEQRRAERKSSAVD